MDPSIELPTSECPDLHLSHPTPEECEQIWSDTAASWKDSLSVSLYFIESWYLTTVPLARKGGMTTWILVDKNQSSNQRQIFCSCESYRKRSLTSDKLGNVEEGLIHGIASVFCPSEYRGRGYGSRHMKELAKALHGWQSEYGKSIGSVLYSDIGKQFYTRLGWAPNPRNEHFLLPPIKPETQIAAQRISESELGKLCLADETMIRKAMATPDVTRKRRMVILPDLDHMLWHIRKEDFATEHIFGQTALAKGAIAGLPGKKVWAIWVHRYYEHPDHPNEVEEAGGNVLYILRLVVEGDNTAFVPPDSQQVPWTDFDFEQGEALKAVLQAAQAEAAEWRLDSVQLWEPSPLVQSFLEQSGLNAVRIERQSHSVASVLWFAEDDDSKEEAPIWINNEHYAWC